VGTKGARGRGYYCCTNFKGRWDQILKQFIVMAGCGFFCWARMPTEFYKFHTANSPVPCGIVTGGKKRKRRYSEPELLPKKDLMKSFSKEKAATP